MFGCLVGNSRENQFPWNFDKEKSSKINQNVLKERCYLSLGITAEQAQCILDLITQELPYNYNAVKKTVWVPMLSSKIVPWVVA